MASTRRRLIAGEGWLWPTKLVDERFEEVRATDTGRIVEDFELDQWTFVGSTSAQRTNWTPSQIGLAE